MSTQRQGAGRRRRWTVVTATAALGLAPAWAVMVAGSAGGCRPKTEPTLPEMPTATEAEPELPPADFRGEALDELVASLEQKAAELPGQNTDDHRRRLHAVFDDVTRLLPILEGPEPSSAFRQQLRTLEAARDRLDPEAGAPAVEPTIDAGLRATYAALNSIGRDEPYAGQRTATLLGQLEAKLDELDAARSVARPYVAADAVGLVAGASRHMADLVAGRATDTPATNPTEPALVPPGAIEAPRTMPGVKPPAAEPAETPAEAAPTEAAPTEEAPAEEAPTEEAPAEEMPAEETPDAAEPATEGDAAAEETPAEEAPATTQPATDEEPAAEPSTDEAAPAEEAPAEDAPAKEDAATDAAEGDAAKTEEGGKAGEEDMNK